MSDNNRDHKTDNIFESRNWGRRTFLKGLIASGVGGLSGVLFRPSSAMALEDKRIKKNGKFVVESTRKVSIIEDVDILVVGGGMAGVGAAVAAGRMGLKTLLVEYFGCLGGNGTSGMVNNFCGYTTSGPNRVQIVQGIGGEIHKMLFQRNGVSSMKSYTFNPEILKMVLDEETAEANVKLLYYTQVVDSIIEKNIIKGVIVENKAGRQAVLAKRVLDCSGDGDVCASGGVLFELGDGMGGYLACDMGFHIVNVGSSFNPSTVNPAAAEAIKSGEYKITRPQAIIQNIMIPGAYWVNWAGVPRAVNGIDPYNLTQAAIDGRKVVRELRRFLRDKIEGMENVEVIDTAPKVGLRETRRVMGGHLLTGDEVLGGTKFKDGIGACAWPIEIVDPVKGRKFVYLKDGDFYTIPYRCLIPQKVENLLMAGRFVSCTHEAQASARVMGPAVVMGQAIGTAAALSIKKGVSPRDLDVSLLQQELVKAGVFLG
ncbi:MAG TPA: FAD-dependent oxidoreductase [Thermodesulfobacteriota bacterium]|nr:FAD-dependent oxidoreductase [Thermodesulfobacteriota bacterium]